MGGITEVITWAQLALVILPVVCPAQTSGEAKSGRTWACAIPAGPCMAAGGRLESLGEICQMHRGVGLSSRSRRVLSQHSGAFEGTSCKAPFSESMWFQNTEHAACAVSRHCYSRSL
jgi:hypothetical protein